MAGIILIVVCVKITLVWYSSQRTHIIISKSCHKRFRLWLPTTTINRSDREGWWSSRGSVNRKMEQSTINQWQPWRQHLAHWQCHRQASSDSGAADAADAWWLYFDKCLRCWQGKWRWHLMAASLTMGWGLGGGGGMPTCRSRRSCSRRDGQKRENWSWQWACTTASGPCTMTAVTTTMATTATMQWRLRWQRRRRQWRRQQWWRQWQRRRWQQWWRRW